MNFNSFKVKDISEELKINTQEKKRIADERGLIAEEKRYEIFQMGISNLTVQRDLST